MKFTEVKNYVKQDLTKFLRPYGFKYEAKAYSFLNVSNKGSIGVATPIADYSPLFKLGFTFTTRINTVEDIYNKFGNIELPFQKYSPTIIVQYDYFKDKRYFDYHFYNESELTFALKDFKELFINQILPFLNKSTGLNNLCEWIQSGEIVKIDSLHEPDNFIHWMIISKLCNTDGYKLAVEKLIEYLQITVVEQDKKRIPEFLKYMELQQGS